MFLCLPSNILSPLCLLSSSSRYCPNLVACDASRIRIAPSTCAIDQPGFPKDQTPTKIPFHHHRLNTESILQRQPKLQQLPLSLQSTQSTITTIYSFLLSAKQSTHETTHFLQEATYPTCLTSTTTPWCRPSSMMLQMASRAPKTP